MYPVLSKLIPMNRIKNSLIHKTAVICFGSRVYHSKVGRYSYIGTSSTICNTKIGNFCSIANHCMISPGKHPIDMISTSPLFYSNNNIFHKSFHETKFEEYDSVTIGNDVWIGSHALIKGGIKIGTGAVIGAYAVVTKDVEPYAIVAGNPAKFIRKRFSDDQIRKIMKSQWWKLSDQHLIKYSDCFPDINIFLNRWNEIKNASSRQEE